MLTNIVAVSGKNAISYKYLTCTQQLKSQIAVRGAGQKLNYAYEIFKKNNKHKKWE